ncbi:MAG TPA: hypothetical protein VFV50_17820, partial [Bdellovibrionales bacterium]|nr:hypothetical protein [Bdellovibrionales bacterium]
MFNRRGVGLVEIVVGLAVLMGISLALISASLLQKQSSLTLATRDACYQVSRNVIANIKAYENDLTVRNWVPGRGNNNTDLVPANARDPLCSTARVKGVCDTDDLLAGNGLGATDRDFNNFLNRRNSATWAYSVYNIAKAGTNGDLQTSMDPAKGAVEPCAVYIADFDPQYLPSPVLPADLYGGYEGLIALKIVQTNATNAQCNTNRSLVAPLSPVFFQVTANVYLRRPGNATWETSCATQAGVGYAPDTTKAALTVEFKNLDEADLNTARLDAARNPATPYNLCLDPNNSPYSPLTWPSARGIIVDLTASEPGAYFRCDVSGSDYPTPGMRKCSAAKLDIVNSAGNRVLEGDFDWQNPSALYNARPVARGQWGSKPFPTPATGVMLPYPTPFDPARRPIYRFAFEATDVGRNQTRVPASPNEFYHFTLEPVCPPRQEYCPNRPPPDDGCGESCPVGTRQGQRCPDPLLYCPQHQPGICDDCERGGFCQPGRKGVVPIIGNKNAATYDGRSTTNPDCPDPATYYPCDIRYNWCGARCPVGTRVPPGPNP